MPATEPTPEARPPWAGWRALLDGVLIFIGAQILVILAVTVVSDPTDRDQGLLVLLLLSPTSTLVMTLLWLGMRYGGGIRAVRGPRAWRWADVPVGLGIGLLCLIGQRIIVLTIAFLVGLMGAELPMVQETFRTIAQRPDAVPVLALTAVVLAPVAEEVLFRGVVFQGLRARMGFWAAALLSATLFTLAHLEGGGVLAGVVIASGILPLGVAFAALLERRGSLLAAIAAHAAYNSVGVALLVLMPGQV